MKYDKQIADFRLQITDDNMVSYTDSGPAANRIPAVSQQLENNTEALMLQTEFEDNDGELMYEEGSIHQKYPAFKPFMP